MLNYLKSHLTQARARKDAGEVYLGAVIGTLVAFGAIVALVWVLVWQTSSFDSTDGGHVAIVRNGGPLDNTQIRGVLPANSGRTNIGFFSTLHNYPTSQRYFTISSTGNADSNDVVNVPTADGVQVGIEGTAYFTLNTDPGQNNQYETLKQFDNKYGTRTFVCTGSTDRKSVWDGDEGFSCFLDQVVSPVINNDLRQSIGDLRCADLVASCSLVQNTGTGGGKIDQSKIGQGNVNLAKIENDISSSLQADLDRSLGGHYLQVQNFNLAKVDLPESVQQAIDKAQASFAQVTQAQAAQKRKIIESQTRLDQARIDAQANQARQKGYNLCPTCAAIDQTKALPTGLTTLVTGSGSGIAVAVPAK
jgi:regulator of protease activity HflC (stomatin/prohibitin superfamily)